MISYKKIFFETSHYTPDLEQISQVTFDHFDDSFLMLLDIRNPGFDWFDNPYIQPNLYLLDQTWKPKIHPTVKLQKCTNEYLRKIIPEHELRVFSNSVCFANEGKLKFKGSWNDENFESLFISIDYCNQKTYKSGICKGEDEIKQFLKENIFTFMGSNIVVNKNLWEYNSDPFFKDKQTG